MEFDVKFNEQFYYDIVLLFEILMEYSMLLMLQINWGLISKISIKKKSIIINIIIV